MTALIATNDGRPFFQAQLIRAWSALDANVKSQVEQLVLSALGSPVCCCFWVISHQYMAAFDGEELTSSDGCRHNLLGILQLWL